MDDSGAREEFDERLDDLLDEPGSESVDLDETASRETTNRRLYRALGMYIVLGLLAYWRLDSELLWFILILLAVLAIKTYLVVVQQRMD